MISLSSRWYEREFLNLSETNVLHDIIVLLGSYKEYGNLIDNDASFPSYYKKNKIRMQHIFVNTANRELKEKLKSQRISASGHKMKRLCCTSKKRLVRSYTWLPNYINYALEAVFNSSLLTEILYNDILSDCNLCEQESQREYVLLCCVCKILGFQYVLLNMYQNNPKNTKKKKIAQDCLQEITKMRYVKKCLDDCNIIDWESKKIANIQN